VILDPGDVGSFAASTFGDGTGVKVEGLSVGELFLLLFDLDWQYICMQRMWLPFWKYYRK
jgi:hypothetical protein